MPIPLKKSELYSSLWKSCDQLRGGKDASQYKDHVLVLLFMKYVSDRYAAKPEDLQDIDGHLRGGIPERDIEVLHEY